MKQYNVYRDIRKHAMIMGLPVSLFALQMLSIIGSLMGIIFSFSFRVVFLALLWNVVLYGILTQITKNPRLFHFKSTLPQNISNKKACISGILTNHQKAKKYEEN